MDDCPLKTCIMRYGSSHVLTNKVCDLVLFADLGWYPKKTRQRQNNLFRRSCKLQDVDIYTKMTRQSFVKFSYFRTPKHTVRTLELNLQTHFRFWFLICSSAFMFIQKLEESPKKGGWNFRFKSWCLPFALH